MAKRITSFDVARLGGVSQSTVSRTFSAGSHVSEKTRQKVLAVATELGYKPDAIARSLSKQNTNIVGIVMARINTPFHPYVLEKLTQRLQELGMTVLLFNTAPDQEIDDILPLVLQYRVDGMIITSSTISSEMAAECSQKGTPVVLFNRYVPGVAVNAVCCDNVEGGRLVANLFLDAGHQRLAYIAGPENTTTNLDREKGFTSRLQERGYLKWQREAGQYTYQSGYAVGKRLLQQDHPPDAIFCASDIIALGVLDVARFELGIKVPEEVAIVGFDDIPLAGWASFGLTTIQQPVDQMINATLAAVTERMETAITEPILKLIRGQLIQRKSTRYVNN